MDFKKAEDALLHRLKSELSLYLTYHSIGHVYDVLQAVEQHIAVSNVTAEQAALLRTAALYHDSGFTVQPDGHEEISCAIAQEMLPAFGYTTAQVAIICGIIMATRIPQSPQNGLEEILADADLDYLGREDFFDISATLFNELKYRGLAADENEWNKTQVKFFENHHYFTAYAIEKRSAVKAKNLEIIKSKIV